MRRPLLALNGDGTLLDYLEAYARRMAGSLWHSSRSEISACYGPIERWEYRGSMTTHAPCFGAISMPSSGKSVPVIPGTVDACTLFESGEILLYLAGKMDRLLPDSDAISVLLPPFETNDVNRGLRSSADALEAGRPRPQLDFHGE
jgi:hypothetical protein